MKAKVCKHEPINLWAAYCHECKHCHAWIKPIECPACEGTGCQEDPVDDCPKCKGTGAKKWRKV